MPFVLCFYFEIEFSVHSLHRAVCPETHGDLPNYDSWALGLKVYVSTT